MSAGNSTSAVELTDVDWARLFEEGLGDENGDDDDDEEPEPAVAADSAADAPIPVLSAESVSRVMATHESLETQHDFEARQWTALFGTATEVSQGVNAVYQVLKDKDPALEALWIRIMNSHERLFKKMQRMRDLHVEVRPNQQALVRQLMDVLMYRPVALAQSRPLLHPTAPLQVPVDTPTMGVRIRDTDDPDEAMLKTFALKLELI